MTPDSDLQALMGSLAGHWSRHPTASDDVEGIARWWFAEGPVVNLQNVEKALMMMKDQGLVECRVAADGRVRWRRASAPGLSAEGGAGHGETQGE